MAVPESEARQLLGCEPTSLLAAAKGKVWQIRVINPLPAAASRASKGTTKADKGVLGSIIALGITKAATPVRLSSLAVDTSLQPVAVTTL